MKIISGIFVVVLAVLISACAGNKTSNNSVTMDEPDLIEGSSLNVQLGVGYMKRGQFNVAKDKLEKALEMNPENIQAYSIIALLMKMMNENESAEDYYRQAIDLDSNNAELHNSFGAFLCSVDKIDEALSEFKKAYEDSFYETAYLARSNAGSCLLKNGDYVEAESQLRQALRINDKLSGALLSMAELGVKTKKYLMSRAYIQRYHNVANPTAESLWIQMLAEKGLGADEYFNKYAKILQSDFPDSSEAGLLEDLLKNDRRN